jgi:DNA primase
MDLLTGASDAALVSRLLAYYRQTAELINASLADTPLVLRHFPRGLDQLGSFEVTPFGLSVNRLLWAIHAKYAVEFHTWAPLPADEDRLQFVRLLLAPPAAVDFARVVLAAKALRTVLADARVQAVPLIDGTAGWRCGCHLLMRRTRLRLGDGCIR